ncbi:MAG: hypothetical protein AMXMBFR58_10000 [Phycisphaerae bacterium]
MNGPATLVRRAALAGLAALAIVASGGCQNQQKDDPAPDPIIRTDPPPTPATVAANYNLVVKPLNRLWARVELRIVGVDDEGEKFDETAEGYLQFVRPGKVALTVKKVGETYFSLGSSLDRYWWMDLRKPRTALIGTLARATPAAVEKFGVPVHPLDLIDLTGVLTIDPKNASTAWSADGRQVIMTLPGRWGRKELAFQDDARRLVAVRLFDAAGQVVCESKIDMLQRVDFPENPSMSALTPVRMVIRIPTRQITVTVRLHDPANKPIKETVFDPGELLRAYNIDPENVRSLDQP